MVLEIPPALKDVYWMVPLADLYQEIWASIGTRVGDAGGEWLILPPGYEGSLYGFDDPYILRSPNVEFVSRLGGAWGVRRLQCGGCAGCKGFRFG